MTNLEIIASEAILNNLYTKEEVESIMSEGYVLPIHTFAIWKSMGYVVKKGEHAKIVTRLWKMTTKKEVNEDTDEIKDRQHMYLVKSYLFTKDQVEKIS